MSQQHTIGTRIVEAREAQGLTLNEVAARVGMASRTLKNWENGATMPRPNKLQVLAGVLGVSMTWLLTGRDEFDTISDAPSRLERLEMKVERLTALQREMSDLSTEIARELAELKQIDEQLEGLAA